jgi:hypothetical protein
MTELIATKSLSYNTRRMQADDAFTAKSPRDARVLTAIGKARYATDEEIAAAAKKADREAGKSETKVPEGAGAPAKQTETKSVETKTADAPKSEPAKTADAAKQSTVTADDLLSLANDMPFAKFRAEAFKVLGIAALEAKAQNG